ncbi:MAG: beta-lactamase family protein [Planctomycetaceae bacterium]|nr:beta-lactamase family protein [Planctomycetaceae bacterium]MEC9003151.1 serine hydrolase domain-containing protein [Planctomycetota bacterium]
MAHLPVVAAKSIDLDEARLEVAYDLLDSWTRGADAPVPGGAILVGRGGKVVKPRFFGRQGAEPDAEPIREDGMFLLASISKPLTYLGALKLVERGKLNLSDPVARYIPDFAAHHKDTTLVQHLFTHTSGLPDMLPDNDQLRRQQAPLERFIQGAIRDTVPRFPPGTQYSYQSMGTLVVAELIQRISGMTIHEYLKKELFDPLGLQSIGLGSRGLDRARLVRVQTPPGRDSRQWGWNSRYWQELGAPWGGVFSSPMDLAVISQLMINGGTHDGVRILSPSMVEMATTNRLDDYPDLPESTRRTLPWGLGWQMNHPGTSGSWSDSLDRQAFGHTGATGTMLWIDRDRDGFCMLLTTAVRSRAPWRLVQLSNIVASAFV